MAKIQQLTPCYRGFNTFWYGDIWLSIDNFISKCDSATKKRNFYFTDNPDNFSNDISNKERIISIDVLNLNWSKDIAVGKTADLITNKVSSNPNYMNSYRYDYMSQDISIPLVGGKYRETGDSYCGLSSLDFTYSNNAGIYSYVKCYILN